MWKVCIKNSQTYTKNLKASLFIIVLIFIYGYGTQGIYLSEYDSFININNMKLCTQHETHSYYRNRNDTFRGKS